MIYKYWDSITVCLPELLMLPLLCSCVFPCDDQREDLEFSVGSKATVWEVKDPLLAGHEYEEESASTYHGAPASLVGGVSGQNLYSKGGYGGRGYPPSSERY